MSLAVSYLGLELAHPFMAGASPLAADLDGVRQLEDAGAAMVVLPSLFEEQLVVVGSSPPLGAAGPEEYLEHLRRVKEAVSVPVVASLNGSTLGGWLDFARHMEAAGADALELNVYELVTDPDESAEMVEKRTLHMVADVKREVDLPIAVKLSPFYTAFAHFARQLDTRGADALVLFNRFYQADVDVDTLSLERMLKLSDSRELLLRLRWLAVLSSQVDCSLAVTGGVHVATDAIKAVLCGATVLQVVSALIEQGREHLGTLRRELEEWMEAHGYDSLEEMRCLLNLKRCPDAAAYERANYVDVLQGWRGDE